MSSVDNRVVEMTFDNAQFERGVAKTIQTLSSLKEALDFKGLSVDTSEIKGSIDDLNFNNVNKAVESVTKKFSAWGTIGDQVLRNIGNGLFGVGKTLVTSIITPLTSGGWNRAMNIEKARFQIQGLGKDFTKLSDDINYAVDGTAYTFDAAASVAAQLSASGIEAGDSMKAALRGVSGVAAMTNSEYSDIGSIFTTVAGNGKLMSDQLNQLSFRGMNAAAILGQQLGKSEAEIRDMTSKGKIDFNTFAKAMDDAFGEHAKAANNTFQGSLANIRAAISKIGQMFSQPIIQQMPDVFNAVRTGINQIKTLMTDAIGDNSAYNSSIKEIIKSLGAWIGAADFSWFANVISATQNAVQILKTVVQSFGDAINNVFGGSGDVIAAFFSDLTNGLNIVVSSILSFVQLTSGDLTNVLSAILQIIKTLVGVIRTGLIAAFDFLWPVVSNVVTVFEGLLGIITRVVNEGISKFTTAGGSLSDTIIKLASALGNHAGNGIIGAFNILRPLLEQIADIFIDIIGVAGQLASVLNGALGGALDSLSETVRLIVDIVGNTFVTVLTVVVHTIQDILDVVKLFAKSFIAIIKPLDILIDLFDDLAEALEDPLNSLNDFLKKIDDVTIALKDRAASGLKFLPGAIRIIGEAIGANNEDIEEAVKFVNRIDSAISNFVSTVYGKLTSALADIKNGISGINLPEFNIDLDSLATVFGGIAVVIGGAATALVNFIDPMQRLNDILSFIHPVLQPVVDWFNNFTSSAKDAVNEVKTMASEGTATVGNTVTVVSKSFGITDECSQRFMTNINNIINVIKDLADKAGQYFGHFKDILLNACHSIDFSPVIDGFNSLRDTVTNAFSNVNFDSIANGLKTAGTVIVTAIGAILLGIKELFTGFDFSNLGTSIKNMGTKISELFTTQLIPAFQNGFDTGSKKIGELAADFGMQLSDLWDNTAIPKFEQGFDSFVDKITSIFTGEGLSKIQNAFSMLGQGLLTAGNWLTDNELSKLLQKIFGPEEAFADEVDQTYSDWNPDDTFSPIRDKIKDFAQKIKDIAFWISELTNTINKSFDDFMYNTNIDPFLQWCRRVKDDIMGLALDYMLIGIARTVNQASHVLKGLGDMFEGLGKMFKNIGKAFSGLGRMFNATAILEVALSLKLIISALSDAVDMWDKAFSQGKEASMIAGIITVGAIFAVLFLLLKSLSKDTKSAVSDTEAVEGGIKGIAKTLIGEVAGAIENIKNAFVNIGEGGKLAGLGIAMLGIAVAVRVIVGAVSELGKIDTAQLIKGGLAVTAITAVIALLVHTFSKAGADFAKAAVGVLAIAVSMKLIISAINDFSNVMGLANFDAAMKGVTAMAAVMAALLVVFAYVGRLSGSGIGILAGAAGIVAISASMILLTEAIRNMSKIANSEALSVSLQGMISILVTMLAMVAVFSQLSSGVTSILAGAAAVAIMMASLRLLSDGLVNMTTYANVDRLKVSITGMVALLITMAASLAVLSKASTDALKASAAIAIVSASLILLSEAVLTLAQIDTSTVTTDMLALAIGLGVMTAALSVLSSNAVRAGVAAVALVITAAALILLAQAIRMLDGVEDIATKALTLAGSLAVLAVTIAILGNLGPALVVGTVALVAIAAAMWIAASAIVQLGQALDSFNTISEEGLQNLENVMNILARTLTDMIVALPGAAALWVVAQGLDVLGPALGAYRDIGDSASNIQSLLDGLAVGLTKMLFAIPGALALAAVALGLNSLSGVIPLYANGQAQQAGAGIQAILSAITSSLGNFAGILTNFSAGSLTSVSDGLVSLAAVIPLYQDVGASPENIGRVCRAVVDGCGGFESLFSGGGAEAVTTASTGLVTLAGALPNYQDVGSAPENIKKVCQAVVDGCGGIKSIFSGGGADSVATVAEALATLAARIRYYTNITSEPENITKVCNAIRDGLRGMDNVANQAESMATAAWSMSTIAPTLEQYSSIDADTIKYNIETIGKAFAGFNGIDSGNLSSTASGISDMASSLSKFPTDLSSISTNLDTTKQSLSDFSSSAPSDLESITSSFGDWGGQIKTVLQDVDLGPEGTNLISELATGMNNSSGEVSNAATAGFDNIDTTKASSAGDSLINSLVGSISNGSQAASDAGSKLAGSAATGMSNNTAGYSMAGSTAASNFASGITSQTGAASSAGNQLAVAAANGARSGSLASAGNSMGLTFTAALAAYSGAAYSAGTSLARGASNGVRAALGLFDPIGRQSGSQYVNGMRSQSGAALVVGIYLATMAANGGRTMMIVFQSIGRQSGNQYASGVRSASSSASSAGSSLANSAASGLRGSTGNMYSIGAFFGQGFVNGVRSKTAAAAAAGAALGHAAAAAAAAAGAVNSPSKVMMRIGDFYSQGFAVGIANGVSDAEKAADKLANSAINATTTVQDIFDSYNPVITPVVDLSSVQSSLNGLNDVYSVQTSMNLAGMAQASSYTDDISYQIQRLRSDMQSYTDAVMSRPQYSWTMGNATINSDEQIQSDFQQLISDLSRRAGMNVG